MAIVQDGSLSKPAGSRFDPETYTAQNLPDEVKICHQYFFWRVKLSLSYKHITFNRITKKPVILNMFIAFQKHGCGSIFYTKLSKRPQQHFLFYHYQY